MGALFSLMGLDGWTKLDARLCMVGLDAAGKTTMLYRLKLGEIVTTIPTIGFNVETVHHNHLSIDCWDVGGKGETIGLIESGGDPSLVIGQITAVLITVAFAGIGSLVLLKLLDMTIGLRVPAEEEQRGLDITAHGEEGYMLA